MSTLEPSRTTVERIAVVALIAALAGARASAQVLREEDSVSVVDYFSVANAGDADGDGIDDFMVGDPFYDTATLSQTGRVTLYSGATGAAIRSTAGAAANDHLGWSVAGAGDVDGDGFADLLVGAPMHSARAADQGLAVVYSGQSGNAIWSLEGATKSGRFGWCVAGIGDLDGDGKSDVLVGSQNAEAFVLDASGNTLHHLTGGNDFGSVVSGCGDLGRDGVKDFLIAEPHYSETFPVLRSLVGAVYAYSGASGTLLQAAYGTDTYDRLGETLAAMGDVDADNVDDYIAGAPEAGASAPGLVRLISGRTGATIREVTGFGNGDLYGSSVTGMGDVDRDGVPDYAVGAIDATSYGRVWIHSGSDSATIYDFSGQPSLNRDFGSVIASGDWNGDGVADLLAGDFEGGPVSPILDVYLMCPAWSDAYGSGWAGKNGIPQLTAVEKPVVGSPLDVHLDNSLGAATGAMLFVGVQTESLTLPGSGTLLVSPLFVLPFRLPAGGLTLSGALPNDPSLDFADVYLQALELDTFATKGASFTPGLQLHCGFDLP